MREMMLKLNKKELERVKKFTKTLSTEAAKDLKKEMFNQANKFRNAIIRSMKETARDTSRSYGKRGHHPSKPGHPPAIDSGNAIRAMFVKSTVWGAMYYIFGAPYMEMHELGKKEPWTIKARESKVLSDGKNYFGKEVTHPPAPKRPFIEPQIVTQKSTWAKVFDRTIGLDIRSWSR